MAGVSPDHVRCDRPEAPQPGVLDEVPGLYLCDLGQARYFELMILSISFSPPAQVQFNVVHVDHLE